MNKNVRIKIVVSFVLSLFFGVISAQTEYLENSGVGHETSINGDLKPIVDKLDTYDVLFEGYESRKIYDRKYILRPKSQIKGVSLPPSVYLKIWDTHTDTITNVITKTGNVQLYWIGPKELCADSKKIWEGMKNQYGIRKLTFMTNGDSVVCLYAVPARWMYNDTLFAVSQVKKYGGYWVTQPEYSYIVVPEEEKMKELSGTTIVKEKSQLANDLNRIIHLKNGTFMWLPRSHDIPTEEQQIMNLFARDINRSMRKDIPEGVKREYDITLFIDSLGCPHLYNYQAMIKDSVDNLMLSSLDYSIRANQYDTFRRLLTMDGDIFPWRFVCATYSQGLWYFKDKIWTEEEKRKYYSKQERKMANFLLRTANEINRKLNQGE